MKKAIRWFARLFGMIAIDWQTAEYLACLSGQVPWGNQSRRRKACADLGLGMSHSRMSTSLECAQEQTWEISIKKL